MTTRKLRWLGAAVGLVLVSVVGCSDAAAPMNELVIVDVSVSAAAERANLVAEAQRTTQEKVSALTPGSRLVVYGFNYLPGTACEPLVFEFAVQGNSEQLKALKATLERDVQVRFPAYVGCLTRDEYGWTEGGSAIFGSVPTALTAAGHPEHPIGRITLVTDGCTWGDEPATCAEGMREPGFAKTIAPELPTALLPDLTGIEVTVRGLGQGTTLQAADIAVLQQVFTDIYAGHAGSSSVTFE